MPVGQSCEIRGVSGQGFIGTLAASTKGQFGQHARVRVEGTSFYAGRNEFILEADDPFALGFELPKRFGDVA